MRQKVVDRVRHVVIQVFPQATVEIYGSFKTKLYLPTSDIDLTIQGDFPTDKGKIRAMLHELKRAIQESNLEIINPDDPHSIKVLENAAVPIIKLKDWETCLQVDLSFNIARGTETVTLVQQYLKSYPCLKYLIFHDFYD